MLVEIYNERTESWYIVDDSTLKSGQLHYKHDAKKFAYEQEAADCKNAILHGITVTCNHNHN